MFYWNVAFPSFRGRSTRAKVVFHFVLFLIGIPFGVLVTNLACRFAYGEFDCRRAGATHEVTGVKECKYMHAKRGNTAISDVVLLLDSPAKVMRVVCWIVYTDDEHDEYLAAINSTWGRKCDLFLTFTTIEMERNDFIIPLDKTKIHSEFEIPRFVWKYICTHYLHLGDWFINLELRSFVVMENLKRFLSQYSSDRNVAKLFSYRSYEGRTSLSEIRLLNRRALEEIGRGSLGADQCLLDSDAESCLRRKGIVISPLREDGVNLAVVFSADDFIKAIFPDRFGRFSHAFDWVMKRIFLSDSEHKVSDATIIFQNLQDEELYVYQSLIYSIRSVDKFDVPSLTFSAAL